MLVLVLFTLLKYRQFLQWRLIIVLRATEQGSASGKKRKYPAVLTRSGRGFSFRLMFSTKGWFNRSKWV